MPFDMKPVEGSKNLAAAGYDPEQKILRVEFNGGNKYDYHGVTEELHTAFWDAPSQGSYLHSVIKVGCPASKVKEDDNASV